MILSTLSRECCGNALAISLGVASREKKKRKKSDRVYALTMTRRISRRSGIMARMPKEGRQKDYVVVDARHGESADRVVGRRRIDNALRIASKLFSRSASSARSAPSRCTERYSRIKTDYIPVSNGGDMSRSFTVICTTPATTTLYPDLVITFATVSASRDVF